MVRRDPKAAETPQDIPPYYIATAPLYIGESQFARAHNLGDRVPVEHVERYGWADLVRSPDGYTSPSVPDQPHSEPATSTGQATTEGKGDA